MYPPNPLLTIVTNQASKQVNTPEWKGEILYLIRVYLPFPSIKWTLDVFSNHKFVSGARPNERMRETTFNTTVKWHKLLQTAAHELNCFIFIYSFIARIRIVLYKLYHNNHQIFLNPHK